MPLAVLMVVRVGMLMGMGVHRAVGMLVGVGMLMEMLVIVFMIAHG